MTEQRRGRLRAAGLTAVIITAAGALAAVTPGHAAAAAGGPHWQSYVHGSPAVAYPVRVVSTSGSVTNAGALTKQGSGTAVITRAAGDPAPSIILDYGQDVGGIPQFTVQAADGSPTLQAGYAETLSFLTPDGDGGVPFESGDPSRSDSYQVTGPGVLANSFIQGGERYQEITLQSPGSLTLSSVNIASTTYRDDAAAYQGHFLSSSAELNKIWYAGAHTLALNMLPADSPGGYWSVQDGYLRDTGGDTGLLQAGADWTDYTMSFRTRINGQQSGFVVRGVDTNTKYLWILDDSADTVGPPDALQEVVFNNGSIYNVANLPVAPIAPGTWHDVSVTVQGTTVTTSVDGTVVGTFDSATLPAGFTGIPQGTVGFREDSGIGEATDFQDLTVTAPDGTVLYSNPLADPSALADFNVPGVNAGNLIMDGAKRDRDVWEGDLSVEAPTLFDTFGAAQYVRDSLQLLGSYQLQSGFIEGRRAPGDPVLPAGDLLPGETSQYSASYSMYFVANLATYYRYTGDLAFIRQEWPIVQRELGWNAQQVDSAGLLETTAADGANWHYDTQVGAQTYENALYYQILGDAAGLATALGSPQEAASYAASAAAVRDAVNSSLFDTATGVYDISTTQRGPVAQDANAYAILYGIAPKAAVPGILAAMSAALSTPSGDLSVSSPAPAGYHQIIGPFMGSYELWARFAAGDDDGAVDLLDREWGQMPGGDPGNTLWEVMGPDGTVNTPGINGSGDGGTSMAHGWSTGPTSALSQYVLGIAPATAGYATWSVDPHPATLAWAQGSVPTPHGALGVQWRRAAAGHQFILDVTRPAGTAGTITVPLSGAAAVVHVNGKLIWANGRYHAAPDVTRAAVHGSSLVITVAGGGSSFRVVSQQAGA